METTKPAQKARSGSRMSNETFITLFMTGVLVVIFLVALVYGYLIVAESPVFSTGLTELVSPGYLGAAMGLQSLFGYTLGMVSPTIFGWALDICRGWQIAPGIQADWGIAFATAGFGGLMGPFFMWLLRREPESARMAGGRR